MAKKLVGSGWRTAAIIFGVLFLLMVGLMAYGMSMTNSENKCTAYCYNKGYEIFSYDYAADKCACYTGTKLMEILSIRFR